MRKNTKKPARRSHLPLLLLLVVAAGLFLLLRPKTENTYVEAGQMPPYDGRDVLILNDNKPGFTAEEIAEITGEQYAPLDEHGRCGSAVARLTPSMMPTVERERIGDIRPTGWHTVKYPDVIEDMYLYNRCHLIAYAMTGQNANERNLVTGTRHLNKELMLPYEKEILAYLDASPRNEVLYRVTPHFEKEELVCRGIELEALSVNDNGRGLCFHVFLYNIQPGIGIDYETGDSRLM